jgi:hypothetical protein
VIERNKEIIRNKIIIPPNPVTIVANGMKCHFHFTTSCIGHVLVTDGNYNKKVKVWGWPLAPLVVQRTYQGSIGSIGSTVRRETLADREMPA